MEAQFQKDLMWGKQNQTLKWLLENNGLKKKKNNSRVNL